MPRFTAPLLRSLLMLFLLIAPALLPGTLHAQSATEYSKKDSKKLLPKALKGAWFGMSADAYIGRASGSNLIAKEEFRLVFEEDHGGKDGLKTVTYYFDGKGKQELYEVILDFESHLTRDAMAFELFGKPNTGKEEWWFPERYAFPVRVWLHEDKLVIVAALPGTAWDGEWE